MIFELAHALGLVPLLWLGLLAWRYEDRGAEWWWLAAAFGVSFVADTAAHWLPPLLITKAYPVSQSALVCFVLLRRDDAVHVVGALLATALVAVAWHGPIGADILLGTVAWGLVVGIVWPRWELGLLRGSLLVTFGLGLLGWYAYAGWPGWWSWSAFQLTRLMGTILFCAAAVRPPVRMQAA